MNSPTPIESAERKIKSFVPNSSKAAIVLNKWSGGMLFFILPMLLVLYNMSCFSTYRFSDVRFFMFFAQTRWITVIALTGIFYHLLAELTHIMMRLTQINITENTQTVSTVLLIITTLFACGVGYWVW